MVDSGYVVPTSLGDALDRLSSGHRVVLAGGSDIYPACSGALSSENILDIAEIPELRGISPVGDGWRIGGLTTWSDLVQADLPPAFDALKQAASLVGAWQIQNVGTLAGNLCNASPAADGVPPLLCLDGTVELSSAAGIRTLAIDDFITGNRSTRLRSDELLSAVILPDVSKTAISNFQKLGSRSYLVISIVMVAVLINRNDAGVIDRARVAVGACSEVAKRLPDLEQALLGSGSESLADIVRADHLDGLSPIDDVRASAAFRKDAALEMIKRALSECQGDLS